MDQSAPPRRARCAALLVCLLGAALACAEDAGGPKAPAELGAVAWARDFAAAQARAKAEGKPLLVLFQEVPG